MQDARLVEMADEWSAAERAVRWRQPGEADDAFGKRVDDAWDTGRRVAATMAETPASGLRGIGAKVRAVRLALAVTGEAEHEDAIKLFDSIGRDLRALGVASDEA